MAESGICGASPEKEGTILPLVTKARNPVLNGVVSIIVGFLVLLFLLFLLRAGVHWAGPMPRETDDQNSPVTSPATPRDGK